MKHIHFTSFLTNNAEFEKNYIEKLVGQCAHKKFEKDAFLLREGEECKYVFFVEKGLLRQYYLDTAGKEHTIQFAPENWLISDRDALFFKQGAQYFIQAVEDAEVLYIEEDLILQLSRQDAAFHSYNNQLLHNHIRQLQKRIRLLLSATAEERYLDFTATYPDLLMRLPQTMVASYLGITPESLSRVRKGLAEKNQRRIT
ncbi:MAG: Crp/Fnr family transcriptional regulator [Saprospiraceae bacterium]|nr:Crp/Fnr family transcriptional regulator [Saprospiraceae bacterium]MBK7220108.1 Crp/Fnr family transcriptional regulator [Saprospiraceae bacterium]MBK8109882.1 Crp/Fnr family transcriptional regulator [Saprospiraceae bacterium]MBK8849388.1 Crp/Fnr family transcriptional regulator [Saprospiraceae bacterium]MBK9686759.1 Crp/Fnr family transcriptional regulator [Saprospiraceae bacterium]